jgi:uncharacterized protein (PEP-CTERM system associated)
MGANRGTKKSMPARGFAMPYPDLPVLVLALGCFTTNAYAVDARADEEPGGSATQAEDAIPTDESTSTVDPKAGWLGFGRSFLKPGNLTGEDKTTATADPLGHTNGSSRLENSSGTTAWFNTGGFHDRGKYQIVPGWTFTPGFEMRETFTDNVAYRAHNKSLPEGAPPNAYEDFVTELDPAIKLIGDERRLKFQLRYLAQSLIYANNTQLSDVRHRLFSAAQAELLPQFLYFDGSTSISQQNTFSTGRGITSNFGPGTFLGGVGDNINYVGDRTDVLSYNLSPYIRSRLRNIATVELRYTYSDFAPIADSADNKNNFSSSLTRGYRALVESGPMFTRFKWRLGFDRRDASFSSGTILGKAQSGSKNIFEKYFTSLEYLIVPQFAALGTVGYEDNDFAGALFDGKRPRGVIWDLGGRWAPSTRTSLQATYGQRFYGDRVFLDLSHRAQHALFHVSYTEEPTLGALVAQAGTNCTAGGLQGASITNPDGSFQTCSSGPGPSNQNSDVLIRRLLTATATYTGLRNDLTVQFYRENREYVNRSQAVQQADQDLLGITGIWTHSLTPDTSMDAAVTWSDVQIGKNGQANAFNSPGQIWNYTLNLNHRLSHNVAALVGFRRVDRSADDPNQEYSENRVFGSIRFNY